MHTRFLAISLPSHSGHPSPAPYPQHDPPADLGGKRTTVPLYGRQTPRHLPLSVVGSGHTTTHHCLPPPQFETPQHLPLPIPGGGHTTTRHRLPHPPLPSWRHLNTPPSPSPGAAHKHPSLSSPPPRAPPPRGDVFLQVVEPHPHPPASKMATPPPTHTSPSGARESKLVIDCSSE